MKRIGVLVFALLLAAQTAVFAGGKKEAAAAAVEITVFAAASMTEAMNELAGIYRQSNPQVNIVYNFDSSGTLKTQIQQGAQCDMFISAGQLQMNQLDIDADPAVNTEGLDFVLKGSRFNIVANQVVLITPANSAKNISDFMDVLTGEVSLIALGNSDVPVGQYAKEIYVNLGVWDALEASGKISYGSNVKEVLSHVESGAVDCGIVYSTDAATAKGVKVAAAAPANSHRPITYPAAVMKGVTNQKAAEDFAAFLKGAEAAKVFERIGFTRP